MAEPAGLSARAPQAWRTLYSAILYLLAPIALIRLAWRGLFIPDYWRRWPERFGFFPPVADRESVWIHAVSVGEVLAAVPLVRALRKRYPDTTFVVTTTTPTGMHRVQDALGAEVNHVYAPYDLPFVVCRFLERIRPRLAIIMETELWPNLFRQCNRRGVALVVANARLSEASARGYRRVATLTRATLADATMIAAQSRTDADRFIALGADPARVQVFGSIKFDIRLPASLSEQAAVLRRAWGTSRPVWVAGSTHEGEEEHVLKAFETVRARLPDCLLVLVPRHPERFQKVAALCQRFGHAPVLRSEGRPCEPQDAVFLGDTMGELSLFYAAADVAFVGGSLVPTGGHNMLEPAGLGIPVIVGPHMFNFEEINRLLQEQGAARQVRDAAQLADVAVTLLADANLRHAMGEKGRAVVESNRGALERLLQAIGPYMGR